MISCRYIYIKNSVGRCWTRTTIEKRAIIVKAFLREDYRKITQRQMNPDTQKNIQKFPLRIKIPDFVSFILKRLNERGFDAYIVGGAVRDALLGREALDWDITTGAGAHEIKSVFKGTRLFSLKHETVTLVDSGIPFEVTAMKGDDGEKANILSDLSHRDFTLNAMAYDVEKSGVIDPFDGAVDIKRKTVKAVNNPVDRFREDPLRMLRAVRIAGELNFSIDKNTFDAIFPLSSLLSLVSVERIRDELTRIILCDNPSSLMETLRKTGLMGCILPELLEGYGMSQNSRHSLSVFEHLVETVNNVPPHNILRFAALLHDIGKPRVRKAADGEIHFYNHESISSSMAGDILGRLRFSREEIKKVASLISLHMIDYSREWTDAAVRRLIRRAGRENIGDLLLLRKADIIAHGRTDYKLELLLHLEKRISKIKNENTAIDVNDLAIDGKKVMDIMGLGPGPGVGKVLRKLLEITIENPELNTEDGLTAILHESGKDLKA